MDFGALPPEVNSARMYTGPGSAPMLSAASGWGGLAAELWSAVAGYQTEITGLAGEGWMGPASKAMAAAAAPYVAWLSSTAELAEQTAVQAKAAAAAYDVAYAATVPPAAIAANRAQLAALIATNFLGQNASAIAATEAQYGTMWAQDAAAMYGYAGASATAAKLAPFSAPMRTTNPAGQQGQAAAVAQATGASAGSGVQSTLSQFVSTTPSTLQALASPAQATSGDSGLLGFLDSAAGGNMTNMASNLMSSSMSPMSVAGITQAGADIAILRGAALAAADPLSLGGLGLPGMGMGMPGLGLGAGRGGLVPGVGASAIAPAHIGGAVVAGMNQATPIGALSVPQSWTAATSAAAPSATPAGALVSSWAAAAPNAEPGGAPGMPGMPMAGSGAGRGYGFAAPRYGFKPTVMGRPVIAG